MLFFAFDFDAQRNRDAADATLMLSAHPLYRPTILAAINYAYYIIRLRLRHAVEL